MKGFLSAVRGIAAAFALFWGIIGLIVYPGFYRNIDKVCGIPGLEDGFVPQGITHFEDEDLYCLCGYMDEDDVNSRIYIVSPQGEEKMIMLSKEDGSVYSGHAGGITNSGRFVYISNASKLFVLEKQALIDAKDGDTVSFAGRIPVPCNASFCSCDGQRVYVGEYHAEGYDTPEDHALTTGDGSQYAAMVFGYRLDESAEYGLDAGAPDIAFAVRDEVQGFAVSDDGRAFLSCSAGQRSSHLGIYDYSDMKPDGVFAAGEAEVPVYYLDSAREIDDMRMPHMSEDIEYEGGRILMTFEAGAKKFGLGLIPFSVTDAVLLGV